jgi:hypothetical protein
MSEFADMRPVWGRIATVQALTGVPDNVLRRLYNDGKVRARKIDGTKANSACVYKIEDVLKWLDAEAAKPAKFKLPEVANG